jgi:hypothetical protein
MLDIIEIVHINQHLAYVYITIIGIGCSSEYPVNQVLVAIPTLYSHLQDNINHFIQSLTGQYKSLYTVWYYNKRRLRGTYFILYARYYNKRSLRGTYFILYARYYNKKGLRGYNTKYVLLSPLLL